MNNSALINKLFEAIIYRLHGSLKKKKLSFQMTMPQFTGGLRPICLIPYLLMYGPKKLLDFPEAGILQSNWCINCVLMRVMERHERDNS